jgi:hypothetical protein
MRAEACILVRRKIRSCRGAAKDLAHWDLGVASASFLLRRLLTTSSRRKARHWRRELR